MRDPYYTIAVDAMQSVFGRTPRGYQGVVIPHILKMMMFQIQPNPVLLVQSTGSGKSMVPLTVASVDGGVSVVIQNTLALGSDQCAKVSIQQAEYVKDVRSFQLDLFRDEKELQTLCDSIVTHCNTNDNTSIIVFTSPETLLKSSCIIFISSLVEKNILRIFCIDKIHLFVKFGLTFRKQFQHLRKKIIDLLRDGNSGSFKLPIILMTATFDAHLLRLLEDMLGLKIESQNIFWGQIQSFQKRHIEMKIKYSSQHFKSMCNDIYSVSFTNVSNKSIIISSTSALSQDLQKQLDLFLDRTLDMKGDTVLVVGNLDTELKFSYTTDFTNTSFMSEDQFKEDTLCPRFLIGTPGCIGAGLDCHHVNFVKRMGLPTSIIDMVQEVGRCGRANDNNSDPNVYSIIFTLNDYTYLIERLYKIKEKDESNDESETCENVENSESPLDEIMSLLR